MAVSATLNLGFSLVQTLATGVAAAGATKKLVTQDLWSANKPLTALSTPAISKGIANEYTLSGSAATIDLTSLVDAGGAALTATGLKLIGLLLTNTGAAVMTIAKGASTGFEGLGATFFLSLPPGASALFFLNAGGTAIDSTHKILDVTGTTGQVLRVQAVFG